MCFSPEASFAGGAVISSIGVVTLKKVRTPSQKVFAGIPLFFGIQQIAEGFVWVTVPRPDDVLALQTSMYIFLLMARVIWPMLIPLAVFLMEENAEKKRILKILLGMGLSVSLYYTYCLIFLHAVPHISGHHIRYDTDYPDSLAVPVFIIYFVASLTPLFLSSLKRTRVVGVLMFLSAVVTLILFMDYLTSVWCFFAAVISIVIYWIIGVPTKENTSAVRQST